jgi:Alw26I/Eco31I/Esp3I family type II restriction endonuclease
VVMAHAHELYCGMMHMARKPEYGRGHPAFMNYIRFIVSHPSYEGMPDVFLDNGEIQWEAPSNRPPGKYQDTHNKRRDWWRRKARELGIDPESPQWISRTAKDLHPSKEKPCKSCGRVMDIRYSYPNFHLLSRIRRLPFFDPSFELDTLQHITELIPRLVSAFGEEVFRALPRLLKAKRITIPKLPNDVDAWRNWIENTYILAEPSILSPGVMSNAPDRLDGFHSFNLCCRQTTDPGRSKQNLQSYTTDRRVFEYWVDGDWVAADRMMGLIRSSDYMQSQPCRNGHPGPCSADHIGPISLGFSHRPSFQLLCLKCNSAKNNRMYLSDIITIRNAADQRVASWYCERLWDGLKDIVTTEEEAGRVCKLFRDNRHSAMCLLQKVAADGHLVFLTTFLGLQYADFAPEFEGVRIENHVTRYDRMSRPLRQTKYALEQKTRRVRIAFQALMEYTSKVRRNALQIITPGIVNSVQNALDALANTPSTLNELNKELRAVLAESALSESRLRKIITKLPDCADIECFSLARSWMVDSMRQISDELILRWNDDRYVREELELGD